MVAPRELRFRLKSEAYKEADIVKACLRALRTHPKVAWVARINSGAFTDQGGRFYRFNDLEKAYGYKMCDILGMLKGGRAIAIECKRVGEEATPEQQAFLDVVAKYGGLSGVAHSFEEAIAIVEGNETRRK